MKACHSGLGAQSSSLASLCILPMCRAWWEVGFGTNAEGVKYFLQSLKLVSNAKNVHQKMWNSLLQAADSCLQKWSLGQFEQVEGV